MIRSKYTYGEQCRAKNHHWANIRATEGRKCKLFHWKVFTSVGGAEWIRIYYETETGEYKTFESKM